MANNQSAEPNCPDCEVELQRIKLIDATQGPGWDNGGHGHIELSYAASDASRSLFLGKIDREGVVGGRLCPACGRILMYAEKR